MGEVIVITSGKGGVGKTTTTANLGTALALMGKRVVLLDADVGLRNLDVALGMENKVCYDLVDVIEKKCRLREALLTDKTQENLFFLAASQTRTASDITPEKMQLLIRELEEQFDYILIDCPAGAGRGFQNAISAAHRAIIVTVPEHTAVRDADKIIDKLEEAGIQKRSLIINRMRPELAALDAILDVDEIVDWLGAELLGVIPEDVSVLISGAKGISVVTLLRSEAGQAFSNTAKRLLGENIPLLPMKKKRKGIFKRARK
ncbi:MAG: septum site-determining protein MinD [Clostridia bacterium]|nr:septum site-determining protein MinD [Clostridia bacterium]